MNSALPEIRMHSQIHPKFHHKTFIDNSKGEFALGSKFKKLGVRRHPLRALTSRLKIGPEFEDWFLILGGTIFS